MIKIETNDALQDKKLVAASGVYSDVYLLNFPKIGLNNPPMAPAILQSIAKQMGAKVQFSDVNLLFQEYCKDSVNKKNLLHEWPELQTPLTADEELEVQNFSATLDIKNIITADIVGISIFSRHSFSFTLWFLQNYRNQIQGKIVVGGAGANVSNFGKYLYEQNLVDYYIIGEGELPWRAILSNQLPYPGVNSNSKILETFSSVPVPDYTGYDLSKYLNSQVHGITIGVEGSRGCVRNCTFCDIRSFWKKYKFKDGYILAQELIELKIKFNVEHFFFNDSLVNGSDKAFRDFIQTLSTYNLNAADDKKIYWSGYYIIKPAVTYKKLDWQHLRDSGIKSLFIGIESGSERVRNHMKKKFSNSDIEYAMQQIQLHGIKCTWLMIIGYPTETDVDFQETLDMLTKYQPMALDRTIDTVALGTTLGIQPGSPLSDMREELNIQSALPGHKDNGMYWKTDSNDFKTRVLRRIQAEEHIRRLGYNSWVGDNDIVDYFEKKLYEIEQGIVSDSDFADHHG